MAVAAQQRSSREQIALHLLPNYLPNYTKWWMPGCGCGDYLDSNIFTPSAPELLAAMHCHQNLVGRQWTVKVRLSDGPDAASPRNLAGYRALCLTKKPPNIDCFVEIARPKDLGVVQVVFLEQTDHQTLHEERIHCEIGLQDLSGTIEKVASFSLDIA